MQHYCNIKTRNGRIRTLWVRFKGYVVIVLKDSKIQRLTFKTQQDAHVMLNYLLNN